ncbi:MAG TPA: hypothetical protein VII01_03765 [Solirubrobacteraceae bacterium]
MVAEVVRARWVTGIMGAVTGAGENRRRRSSRSADPPSIGSAVGRFMLGSLAAIAVVVVGGFFALRSITIEEARRDSRERVEAEGHLVEAAGLTDGVLRGDRAALTRLDDVVVGQVLAGSIVRVKVWSTGGRILYSDEPSLIGRQFSLGRA